MINDMKAPRVVETITRFEMMEVATFVLKGNNQKKTTRIYLAKGISCSTVLNNKKNVNLPFEFSLLRGVRQSEIITVFLVQIKRIRQDYLLRTYS